MSERPHQVDLETVSEILREAREQAAEVLSEEVPKPADMRKLGAVKLEELDGSTITVAELWKDRPAAMVFLRHYG